VKAEGYRQPCVLAVCCQNSAWSKQRLGENVREYQNQTAKVVEAGLRLPRYCRRLRSLDSRCYDGGSIVCLRETCDE